ncbi:hypothetical protein L3X38_044466 [Prunus dulcis]|uniref:Uncharacterized protein n=1 Tax=Prunus dulcis TaxID=3755 RepID=A0AAD4UYQ0_PRUDU|nr:hypothetical protein L3X38_044466 [Prunus dulcis]
MKQLKNMRESGGDPLEQVKVPKATWKAEWHHIGLGSWAVPSHDHAKGDHSGILQVMLKPLAPDFPFGRGQMTSS